MILKPGDLLMFSITRAQFLIVAIGQPVQRQYYDQPRTTIQRAFCIARTPGQPQVMGEVDLDHADYPEFWTIAARAE